MQEGRHASRAADDLLGQAVQLPRRHTRSDLRAHLVQHLEDDPVGPVHHLDLAGGLEHHQPSSPRATIEHLGRHLVDRDDCRRSRGADRALYNNRSGARFFPDTPEALPHDLFAVVVRPSRAAPSAAPARPPARPRAAPRRASLPGPGQDPCQGLGLDQRPRIAVEDEALPGVRLGQPLPHHSAMVASSTSSPDAMIPFTFCPSAVPPPPPRAACRPSRWPERRGGSASSWSPGSPCRLPGGPGGRSWDGWRDRPKLAAGSPSPAARGCGPSS